MDTIGIDILLERPYIFEVGGECFSIHPPSLGVLSLMQIRLQKLNISQMALQSVANLELYRVAATQKAECCQLIAMATCHTRADVLNTEETERRAELFKAELENDAVATLIVAVLQFNRHQQWMDEAGITDENKRLAEIARYKDRGNCLFFGGKTVYGRLLDPVMKRYGWTFEYAVWGVSVSVLEVLMTDKVTEIVLTDEERKKIPARFLDQSDVIRGDDPRNWEMMQKMMDM